MEGFDAAQGVVLNDSAQQLVNDVLVWIGFGTVIGLLAKGIVGRAAIRGRIATVLMGVGGTILGYGVVNASTKDNASSPSALWGWSSVPPRDAAHSVLLQVAGRPLLP